MNALVILFLALLAVGSSQVHRRPMKKIHHYSQGSQVYGASLGGSPVGMYSRESPRFVGGRHPKFAQPNDAVYGAVLGGAQASGYARYGPDGTRIHGASLQKAPVGMYSRGG